MVLSGKTIIVWGPPTHFLPVSTVFIIIVIFILMDNSSFSMYSLQAVTDLDIPLYHHPQQKHVFTGLHYSLHVK